MFTLPYRTLFHQKRWATNGLRAVIAENAERLPVDDQVVICRLLDHIQVVDDIFRIFRHNLEARRTATPRPLGRAPFARGAGEQRPWPSPSPTAPRHA